VAGQVVQVPGFIFNVGVVVTTGSLSFSWTVSDPGMCAGAAVAINSTAGATPVMTTGDCGMNARQIDNLAPGPYTFQATLSGGPVATPVVVDGISATVVGGAVTPVPAIPFQVGGGGVNLTVSWTVNGGQFCPPDPNAGGAPGGTVTVTGSGGATPINTPAACTAFSATIPGVAPGQYTISLALQDPGHLGVPPNTATTPAPIDVMGVGTNVGPIDIICPCCPNPPPGVVCQ
jgi:hypothetical protein